MTQQYFVWVTVAPLFSTVVLYIRIRPHLYRYLHRRIPSGECSASRWIPTIWLSSEGESRQMPSIWEITLTWHVPVAVLFPSFVRDCLNYPHSWPSPDIQQYDKLTTTSVKYYEAQKAPGDDGPWALECGLTTKGFSQWMAKQFDHVVL